MGARRSNPDPVVPFSVLTAFDKCPVFVGSFYARRFVSETRFCPANGVVTAFIQSLFASDRKMATFSPGHILTAPFLFSLSLSLSQFLFRSTCFQSLSKNSNVSENFFFVRKRNVGGNVDGTRGMLHCVYMYI